MPILEKAFAKINGNYAGLVGGWPERAVSSLIGTPGFRIATTTYTTAALWAWINNGKEVDIMVANTIALPLYNLVGSHSYTLLNNYNVTLTNGTSVLLIQLRNPWGSDISYTNAYRDGDTLWL